MAWNPFRNFFNFGKYVPNQPKPQRPAIGLSAGTVVTDESARQVSAFNRGLVYISTQVAKLPWYVKGPTKIILRNNPLHVLLNVCPNDEMNAFDFKVALIQNALTFGNGYAEIVRDMRGQPTSLHLIDSRDVDVFRDPNDRLVYRIIGGSALNHGEDAYLAPRDIYHIKNFTTSNGVIGQGVVGYALNTLGITLGADQFANSLYANSGIPSGVLEVQGTLDDESFERIKESWNEAHGRRKTGGVAVLEEGVKYSSVASDPEVLQFLESRKFNVIEVARFLGVPPQKLFDSDSAKYNNIEHANIEVVTDTLDAWARSMEIEADVKLLNKQFGGKHTEFDMSAVFRGDMETRGKYFSNMMQTASITPNEIREKEGMAPYEQGDRFFIASNNFTPADRIDEVLDAQVSKNQPEQIAPPPEDDEDDSALNEAALRFLNSKTSH